MGGMMKGPPSELVAALNTPPYYTQTGGSPTVLFVKDQRKMGVIVGLAIETSECVWTVDVYSAQTKRDLTRRARKSGISVTRAPLTIRRKR